VVEEHGFDMLPVGELPDNVDWRTKGMGTVPKDQVLYITGGEPPRLYNAFIPAQR